MGHSQIWNSFLKVKSALRRIGLLSVMLQICFKNDAFVAWKFLIWYSTLKTVFSTPAVQGKNIYFWNVKRLHFFSCLSMLTHFKNFNIKIVEHIQSNEVMILQLTFKFFIEIKKFWHTTYSNSVDIIHIGIPIPIIERRRLQIFWYVPKRGRGSVQFRKKKGGFRLQRGGAPFAFQLQSCQQSFCLGRSLKTLFTSTICLLN